MIESLNTKKIIANNLNRIMNYRNMTRKDVCAALDIKYTTFCEWVNGRAYPRIEALEKLAAYFDIEVGDFFVDLDRVQNQSGERVMEYVSRLGEIDMAVARQLTEEQLHIMVQAGVHIKRKSLEEYVNESTGKKMIPSAEIFWGKAVGDEVW